MSRSSALILLGVLTILTPFSGLPSGFRTFLTAIFGAAVFGVGLLMRARETARAEASAPPELAPLAPAPEAAPEPPQGVSPI